MSRREVTFLCVWSGDSKFSPDFLEKLKKGIERFLPDEVSAKFVCISPKLEIPGGWTREAAIPMRFPDEEGCWYKLQHFIPREGACVALDLDCIITGDVSVYAPQHRDVRLHAWPDPWRVGHLNSAVLAWNGESAITNEVWADRMERIRGPRLGKPNGQWNGDQDFTREHLLTPWVPLEGIKSYKAHCNPNTPPTDCRVIMFHGKPKNDDLPPGNPYRALWDR